MKKFFTLFFIVALCYISGAQTWNQKTNYPGTPRNRGRAFSIPSLGKGYVIGGYDGIGILYQQDTYEYDTLTGNWTKRANYPGASTCQATFSINGFGYAGTGVTYSNYDSTFWQYDPVNDIWNKKAHFPGAPRAWTVGFSINGKGYMGGGCYGSTGYSDFYVYDPPTDTWDTMRPCPALGVGCGAVAFSIGGKGYVGTGAPSGSLTSLETDFWEYDPAVNKWTQKSSFPGTPRGEGMGFATCDKGYIGCGYIQPNNDFVSDFWQYDPAKDRWSEIARYAGGKGQAYGTGFGIGKSGYAGLGHDSTSGVPNDNDWWEFTAIVTPAFTTVGGSATVCTGQSVSFTDTSGFSPTNWQWSFPGGTPNTSTGQNPVISYDTAGTWDVTLTAYNGCDSATKTFSKYITVSQGGILTIVPASASVCSGTSVTLTVSGGAKITWSPASTLNKTTGDTVIANPSLTTTYTATDSSGSCIAAQQVVVTIVPSDTGGKVAAVRDTICGGTKGTLNLGGNNSNVLQWQSSLTQNNFTNITGTAGDTLTTNPLSQSTYFRVMVGTGSCTAFSDTLCLVVPPPLIANFTNTCLGIHPVIFSDSSVGNIVSYSWTFGDGTTSILQNPTHSYAKNDTTYNACLTIYDGSNCSYTFCKEIDVCEGIAPVNAKTSIQIYPNPVSKQLAVSGLQLAGSEIDIIDILGRTLLAQKATTNQTTIDVSGLPAGIYLVEVINENGTVVKKFVKE